MKRRTLGAVVALGLFASTSLATTIEIQMVDVDISYDASTGEISSEGDSGDPLSGVFFFVDNVDVGSLLNPPLELSLDLTIPGVFGIDVNGDTVESAQGGSLELLVPDSALLLTLDTVEVVYQPVFGAVGDFRFTFIGTVGSVATQALPFDLRIGEPVTVTLSTQATAMTASQGQISMLKASGTGELRGEFVVDPNNNIPEPRTMALLGSLGMVGMLAAGRPRRS